MTDDKFEGDPDLLDKLDREIEEAESRGDTKAAKLLKQARDENARRRIRNHNQDEKISQRDAQIQQLQQDYQALEAKLIDGDSRLTTLQSELEAERAARQALVERDEKAAEAAINRIPEKYRALVPKGLSPSDLRDWLDAAAYTLGNVPVPPLEGQVGSTPERGGDDVVVDESTAMVAKALGVDAQALAKRVKDGN